ncbi:MAG: glutathione S-transferase family protein [Woeseia sp.]
MYQLYGDIGSGSAIVEMALAEIRADVQLREVPLKENAQKARKYAAINPQRKLPCLITPDGETLTESAAILLALDDRHRDSELLPTAPEQRALAYRWLIFMAAELYPLIEIVDYPERFQPEGEDTPAARRKVLTAHMEAMWQRRFLIVERAIGGDPWFLPGGFSALDIYVSVLSRWTRPEEFRKRELPKVERIAAKLAKRRRVNAVWRRHFAG